MAHPPVDECADRLPPGHALACILAGVLVTWAIVALLLAAVLR